MQRIVLILILLLGSGSAFASGDFQTGFKYSNAFFVFILLAILYIIHLAFRNALSALKQTEVEEKYQLGLQMKLNEIREIKKVTLYLTSIFLFLYIVYFLIEGTSLESHVIEWLNLIVRWTHVVFGIAWIGASFYFNFLENSLNRKENLRDELAGNLWAIHGGGFYYLEKYKTAPKEIPKHLHWFKYEAYFTWLSGFLLLAVVYYLDAKVYLIDPVVCDLSAHQAVAIGIGSLFIGWIVYDLLCKSRLSKKPELFGVILFLFIAGFAFLLLQVFNARAAYIHVGALIGTMMVGNVFRVIIPSQKAMVQAAFEGKLPDPQLGKNALLRSRHNNYLTLPVIFIMISNHYPSTYGNSLNWIILMGLTICSVLVKHFLNKMEKGEKAVWILPIAFIGMISLAIISRPVSKEVCKEGEVMTYQDIQPIIQKRCIQCHSSNPTDDVLKIAPNGIKFDSPEECVQHAQRILQRAVLTKTMPQVNKTGMTQEERDALQCWIEGGAVIK